MTRHSFKLASWLLMLLALGIYGCSSSVESTATDSPAMGDMASGDSGEAEAGGDEDAAAIEASILKLPEADQALARAQKNCPVSGEALGVMGPPVKVSDVGGRDVFVCCDSCVEDLKADPEKFLAKLDSAAAETDAQ